MPTIEEKIANLDGFVNTKTFFENNDLRGLSDKQLRQLVLKVSTLDAHFQLSAIVSLVQSELDSRDAYRNFKITTTIAVIALVISIIALFK